MQVKIFVAGLGNVGRRLLELMERKRGFLRRHFDLEFIVIAAADSSGTTINLGGLDSNELIALKTRGEKICRPH